MAASKAASIKDVAELAGVSTATVSRVLNGSPLVRDRLRDEVIRAANELGYRPNRIASNLRRQRSNLIGVLVSDIENPHSAEFLREAEGAAYELGYRVILCNADAGQEKQAVYLRMLASERVAGVILSATDPAASEISELLNFGIPVVAVDKSIADQRADAVLVNNQAAGERAAAHLLSHGIEDIAFVGGPEDSETALARLRGYRATMQQAGLAPRWQSGDWDIEAGRATTSRLLDSGPTPHGLVTANNLITVGALRELKSRRLSVPDDVAVVAFDDPFWSELMPSPLTALRQPITAVAREAVDLLLERMQDERVEPISRILDFDLIQRESCGCDASGPYTAR